MLHAYIVKAFKSFNSKSLPFVVWSSIQVPWEVCPSAGCCTHPCEDYWDYWRRYIHIYSACFVLLCTILIKDHSMASFLCSSCCILCGWFNDFQFPCCNSAPRTSVLRNPNMEKLQKGYLFPEVPPWPLTSVYNSPCPSITLLTCLILLKSD